MARKAEIFVYRRGAQGGSIDLRDAKGHRIDERFFPHPDAEAQAVTALVASARLRGYSVQCKHYRDMAEIERHRKAADAEAQAALVAMSSQLSTREEMESLPELPIWAIEREWLAAHADDPAEDDPDDEE